MIPVLISYLVNEHRYQITPLGLPFTVDATRFEELFSLGANEAKPIGVRNLPIPLYRKLMELTQDSYGGTSSE